MEVWMVTVVLFLLGAVFGSFAGAQVWRLRAREYRNSELDQDEISAKEKKKLTYISNDTLSDDRSRCLACGKQLAWYDMVPVVSWIWLKGRCRYCNKSIGATESLLELGLGVAFVLSYYFWPFALAEPTAYIPLGIWLVSLVLASILLVYDLKWFILPDRINYPYAALGLVFAIAALATGAVSSVLPIVGSVMVMSGVYLVLYWVSKGAWVGFGDVKLGLGLGLFLLDWKLALVALFLANLIGTIVIMPLLLSKKISRKSVVPFGPFLLLGTFVSVLLGNAIVDAYLQILL